MNMHVKQEGVFKVGDKVRYTGDGYLAAKKGATATVVREKDARYDDMIEVAWDRNGLDGDQMDGGYYRRYFELAPEFAVGDRVRFTDECDAIWWFGPHTKHHYGVIKKDRGADCRSFRYVVKISDEKGDGFVDARHIERVEQAKFKVGDYITNPDFGWIGRGYRVTRIDRNRVCLDPGTGGDPISYYLCDDFVLVRPASHAIVARLDNGKPRPAVAPYVHADTAAAKREAARLAKANPGCEFGVYELVDSKREDEVFEHEWQRLAVAGRKIEAIKKIRSMTGLDLKTSKDAIESWLSGRR